MVLATTISSIACLVAIVVIIYFSIVRNRCPFSGTTPIGWWIIGLGISQLFLLVPFAMWYEEWWYAHQIILNISLVIAAICAVLWLTIWIAQRR